MNPTGQPFQQFPQETPPSGNAQQELNVPSILIMVMGGLGVLFGLLQLVTPSGGSTEQLDTMMNDPNFPPAARTIISALAGGAAKGFQAFAILLDALIIFGAVQMRNLKLYPLAITSAILSMLPCTGCCCLFGLPVGIWAITILVRADVKEQFT